MPLQDQDLLEHLQYMVLEPPDGGQSWPSGLWDREEVLDYLTQRQNRLIKETLLAVGEAAPVALAINTRTIALPQDCVKVIRVVWIGNNGVTRPVERSDAWGADHHLPTWPTATGAFPLVYIEQLEDTLTLTVAPAPAVAGQVLVQYVGTAPRLSGDGELFGVPDPCLRPIFWGALADMVAKVGRGHDPRRGQHAELRYQLGREAIRLILGGRA